MSSTRTTCGLVVLLCVPILAIWRQGDFNYDRSDDERGPYAWHKLDGGNSCNGTRQSPIDIRTDRVTGGQYKRIRYIFEDNDDNGGDEIKGEFHNDGHTAEFSPHKDPPIYLKRVPFFEDDTFVLDQLHFHFGRHIYEGSEHAVNSHFFSGEVHLKHYNKKYGSPGEAIKHKDGLVAVGIFVQAVDDDDDDDDEYGYGYMYNFGYRGRFRKRKKNTKRRRVTVRTLYDRWITGRELDSSDSFREDIDEFLQKYLPKIRQYDRKLDDVALNPMSLFPDSDDFYFYEGSLTTPPCAETVTWVSFRNPVSLSKKTFKLFRRLLTRDGYPMGKFGIFRPLQPLNGRKVYSNF